MDSVECLTVEDRSHTSGANQAGCASGDQPLVVTRFSSNDDTTFYQEVEPKMNDLLQASLRFFQKKRDDLVCPFQYDYLKNLCLSISLFRCMLINCSSFKFISNFCFTQYQHKCLLQDEIARCEMNIQRILSGNLLFILDIHIGKQFVGKCIHEIFLLSTSKFKIC